MNQQMNSADVVVVGSINADLGLTVDRLPHPGETVPGRGGRFTPGGKGANQALAARLCGARVALIGAVGDDALAEPALSLLRDAGVDLSAVSTQPGPTGLAVVTVDQAGENEIVVVAGANAALDAARITPHAEQIGTAPVVVLQGEIPVSGIERAASLSRHRLVINLAPVVPVAPELLRTADPLVVNEHEAELALRLLVPGADAGGDAPSLAAALGAHGCRSVVCTMGAGGSVVYEAGTLTRVDAEPVGRVVDTTGAGDAFVGALAAGLAHGRSLLDAARSASRVAAATIGAPGAQASYAVISQLPDEESL